MNLRNRLPPAVFAYRWNKAFTFAEAVKSLRMKPRSATMRAAMYRMKYGIPLQKFFDKGPEVDWGSVRLSARRGERERLKARTEWRPK